MKEKGLIPTTDITDYSREIERRARVVFDTMRPRVSDEDYQRLVDSFEVAREAHSAQKRKTGEPYIFHPIAVATIAAKELNLDIDSVIAAFLHDVVEDSNWTIEQLQKRFGNDVAFLVRVVTKQKKEKYEMSKQLDNFKQMLNSVQYDIRALLVKLADRLHNMRTLSSMQPDKQMKIAGETDYFYAPLATRLGLYNVKTELENLSLRFRCPHEYSELAARIEADKKANASRLKVFTDEISNILRRGGIKARVYVDYRQPYSLWRKMHKYGDDFDHLKYRHFVEIVFKEEDRKLEKDMALKIYSLLTDRFKEKPGGISNYIDSPKENGYQSFHLKLLADFGRWQEVHISSERMVTNSQFGCLSDRSEGNIRRWINKFRENLREISKNAQDGGATFIENVVASFYNDDIMVFTPQGKPIVLPQKSTVLDFAYEVHSKLGAQAKYARINGRLASIKTPLHRGDIIEVFSDPNSHPVPEWLDSTVSYKARKAIRSYLAKIPKPKYDRCPICKPMPDEEVIGFKNTDGRIMVHKRDCPEVIKMSSQLGDNIVSVDFEANDTLYPVEIEVVCVDRPHMVIDLVDSISNTLNLSIGSINTKTEDSIATILITFAVHSYGELRTVMEQISKLPDIDSVREIF
ncbi:MAG: HD domain-containing protein [Muribaculaceae bacterium]|nr:HD domain-containing protein [Muribaculaceae bacterium]